MVDMTSYLGLRITAPHHQCREWIDKLFPEVENRYLFWGDHHAHPGEHLGAAHDHCHVAIPMVFAEPTEKKKAGEAEKLALQKRINRELGIKGNLFFAVSIYDNGMESAATYIKHDAGAVFHFRDPRIEDLIGKAPLWVEKRPQFIDEGDDDVSKVDRKKNHMMLSEANLLNVMRKFARVKKLEGEPFNVVLQELLRQTRWRPSQQLRKFRIPGALIQEYEEGMDAVSSSYVDYLMSNRGSFH